MGYPRNGKRLSYTIVLSLEVAVHALALRVGALVCEGADLGAQRAVGRLVAGGYVCAAAHGFDDLDRIWPAGVAAIDGGGVGESSAGICRGLGVGQV